MSNDNDVEKNALAAFAADKPSLMTSKTAFPRGDAHPGDSRRAGGSRYRSGIENRRGSDSGSALRTLSEPSAVLRSVAGPDLPALP